MMKCEMGMVIAEHLFSKISEIVGSTRTPRDKITVHLEGNFVAS